MLPLTVRLPSNVKLFTPVRSLLESTTSALLAVTVPAVTPNSLAPIAGNLAEPRVPLVMLLAFVVSVVAEVANPEILLVDIAALAEISVFVIPDNQIGRAHV